MKHTSNILIFGEVLFDCFPTGEQILGGAPFNVAWHLQAFGDAPTLLSSVGDDALGKTILTAMDAWGMHLSGVQIDPLHPTGQVNVQVIHDEPHYSIASESAYDFIDADKLSFTGKSGILYHGTLGVRHDVSKKALLKLAENPNLLIFLDVNLRTPWWKKEEVFYWLQKATWVKLNQDELKLLGFTSSDIHQSMTDFQSQFQLEQLILTRGSEGAIVLAKDGQFHHIVPEKAEHLVDTVGAGDAFSAVYIHGLLLGWPIQNILSVAQQFALKVIGLRGATTKDPLFYQEFTESVLLFDRD